MAIFEEFDDTQEVDTDNLNEDQKFTKALVDLALSGKHQEFGFIRSEAEYDVLSTLIKADKKVVKAFKKSAQKVFKELLEEATDSYTRSERLIEYRTLLICINFYEEEVRIAEDYKDEYLTYILSGHLIDLLLGKERPEEDLRDFRKK